MNVIGRLQRVNPLPPGVYWLDVIDDTNQSLFSAWSFENAGKVDIITSEHFDALGWPDCNDINVPCGPSRDWVKFRVNQPVSWDAVKFGFPEIIEPGEVIESSADTASVPDMSDYCDISCQAQRVAISAAVVAASVVAVALAVNYHE